LGAVSTPYSATVTVGATAPLNAVSIVSSYTNPTLNVDGTSDAQAFRQSIISETVTVSGSSTLNAVRAQTFVNASDGVSGTSDAQVTVATS